jgi:transcriptional regulator with XRE-family HTH domain
MNKCAACAGASVKTKIIPKYDADALGAPFKVYLMDAVKAEVCSSCGKILNTGIPDPEGLLYAISFERVMHPRKLVGAEIKFLRHIMGWKAKKLADQLGITVEYLSRCENGHVVMSVTTEKLLRLLAVLRPGPPDEDKTPEAQEKVRDIVEDALRDLVRKMSSFQIESSWIAGDPLEFHFYRRAFPARTGGLSPRRWPGGRTA